jgi:hypothetical protein
VEFIVVFVNNSLKIVYQINIFVYANNKLKIKKIKTFVDHNNIFVAVLMWIISSADIKKLNKNFKKKIKKTYKNFNKIYNKNFNKIYNKNFNKNFRKKLKKNTNKHVNNNFITVLVCIILKIVWKKNFISVLV